MEAVGPMILFVALIVCVFAVAYGYMKLVEDAIREAGINQYFNNKLPDLREWDTEIRMAEMRRKELSNG